MNSWKLASLKGRPPELIEAVNAAAFVPPGAKALLAETLAALPNQSEFIRLDAHCHVAAPGSRARCLLNLSFTAL